MKFENSTVSMTPEILKRKLGGELLVPVTLDFASVTGGVVKAGSPISEEGVVANDATAIGILLNDVYEENPNGSLIKGFAAVNTANAEANSGLTIDQTVKTALSTIDFE